MEPSDTKTFLDSHCSSVRWFALNFACRLSAVAVNLWVGHFLLSSALRLLLHRINTPSSFSYQSEARSTTILHWEKNVLPAIEIRIVLLAIIALASCHSSHILGMPLEPFSQNHSRTLKMLSFENHAIHRNMMVDTASVILFPFWDDFRNCLGYVQSCSALLQCTPYLFPCRDRIWPFNTRFRPPRFLWSWWLCESPICSTALSQKWSNRGTLEFLLLAKILEIWTNNGQTVEIQVSSIEQQERQPGSCLIGSEILVRSVSMQFMQRPKTNVNIAPMQL